MSKEGKQEIEIKAGHKEARIQYVPIIVDWEAKHTHQLQSTTTNPRVNKELSTKSLKVPERCEVNIPFR